MIIKYLIDGNPISKLPPTSDIDKRDLLNIDRHLTVWLSDFIYDTKDILIESDIKSLSTDIYDTTVVNIIKRNHIPDDIINVSVILPETIKNGAYLHFRSLDEYDLISDNNYDPSLLKEQFKLCCYFANDDKLTYFNNSKIKSINMVDGTTIKFSKSNGVYNVDDVSHSNLSILTRQELIETGLMEDVETLGNDLSMQLRINYKLTYLTLLSNLLDEYLRMYHLSSMAYRDFWEYALKSHPHGYNKFDIIPEFSSGIDLGHFKIVDSEGEDHTITNYKTTYRDIYIPKVSYEHKIGELKFFAQYLIPTKAQILLSMTDGTFDGWVYPDGTTYARYRSGYDFTDAYNLYRTAGTTTLTFTVPQLTSFFNANNNTNNSLTNEIQWKNWQNGLVNHTHNIMQSTSEIGKIHTTIPLNKYQNGNIRMNADDKKNKDVCFHFGRKETICSNATKYINDMTHVKVITPNNSIYTVTSESNLYTTINLDNTTHDRETHPSFNRLPVMIYIGNKKA